METRILLRHVCAMQNGDMFIAGLRKVFEADTSLKESPVAMSAGLDNSTIRKWFDGSTRTAKIDAAQKVANVLGMKLSTIIALAESDAGPDVVRLALAISRADPAVQQRVDHYLEVHGTDPEA